MKEIWKDIKNYEGLYQVSNLGRVKSLYYREKILIPQKSKNGYLRVNLSKNGVVKKENIHKLVAQAFISNIDNLSQINHKNENKEDNNVNNLEWCDSKYNMNYGSRPKKNRKRVNQYDLNNNLIMVYSGIRFASRKLNIPHQNIIKVCKGEYKQAGGYIWDYTDEDIEYFERDEEEE